MQRKNKTKPYMSKNKTGETRGVVSSFFARFRSKFDYIAKKVKSKKSVVQEPVLKVGKGKKTQKVRPCKSRRLPHKVKVHPKKRK